jgi:hypothetical protein
LEENQIDFSPIINTYHDSDSAKDWNPLYKLAGRTEKLKNDSLSNLNLLYPEDF